MNPGRRAIRDRLLAMAGLGIILSGLILCFSLLGGGASDSGPRYSTYSFEPDGVRGFYEFLQEEGLRPQRMRESLEQLAEHTGVLFIIEPEATTGFEEGEWVVRIFTPAELDAIEDWVWRGNVVVLLAADGNEIHAELGIIPPGALAVEGPPADTEEVAGPVPVDATEGLPPVPVPTRTRMKVEGTEHVPILGSFDAPAGIIHRRGQGAYIVIADAWIVTNEGLLTGIEEEGAGFRLLYSLALRYAGVRGEVLFDEAHHGFLRNLGVVAFLKRHGVHNAVIQLLVVFLFAAWRCGARFGEPVPPRPPRDRDLTEYVGAVANIYQRAHLRQEAVQTILGGLVRELAARLRMPPGSTSSELLAVYEEIDPARAARWKSFLVRARRVSQYHSSREFTDLCRRALELREEVKEWKQAWNPSQSE